MKKKQKKENTFLAFLEALDEIARQKGIDKEEIIESVEAGLKLAYKKDRRTEADVHVQINRDTGELLIFAVKTVVEAVEDPAAEMTLEEARAIQEDAAVGDEITIAIDPRDFCRAAAVNAKQIVVQKLKDAERNAIYEAFAEKKDEIITGIVQRVEHGDVFLNLFQGDSVMGPQNQIKGEEYYAGMRLKVYVVDVLKTTKGPQIVVSRSHSGLVKRLFELEVPEIFDGTIEIKAISREAGSRTKIAVWASNPEIDPVGACVGFKGTRIQNILSEINNEKIDVIRYSEDVKEYVTNALSPAKVEAVYVDEEQHSVLAVVDASQLSLAIGKDGQNVRLAARLTGWKIDIKDPQQYEELLQNAAGHVCQSETDPDADPSVLLPQQNDTQEQVLEEEPLPQDAEEPCSVSLQQDDEQ